MLHEDRVTVRRIARAIHDETSALPLVCPHGHVDPALLATDEPFQEPASLIVTPDHYLLRMLHSRGISLESMGIAPRGGGEFKRDPRAIWRRFAAGQHLFRATPTALWLDYELAVVFGIETRLDAERADRV